MIKLLQKRGVDVIIHCAANAAKQIDGQSITGYLEDNVFLTQRLLSIPHRQFIYLSSVDIYPKNKARHEESEIIHINEVSNFYAFSKFVSESLVCRNAQSYVILRATSLLGPYARLNNLIKVAQQRKPVLTLSRDSVINCVAYHDVVNFIKLAIRKNLRGVYNMASARNISMAEIVKRLGKKVKFGSYRYCIGSIGNRKISRVMPEFRKTSWEVIRAFIEQS